MVVVKVSVVLIEHYSWVYGDVRSDQGTFIGRIEARSGREVELESLSPILQTDPNRLVLQVD